MIYNDQIRYFILYYTDIHLKLSIFHTLLPILAAFKSCFPLSHSYYFSLKYCSSSNRSFQKHSFLHISLIRHLLCTYYNVLRSEHAITIVSSLSIIIHSPLKVAYVSRSNRKFWLPKKQPKIIKFSPKLLHHHIFTCSIDKSSHIFDIISAMS